MKLREYQQEQLKKLITSTENTCIQSPTGTGKSVVIKSFTEHLHDSGAKVAIIAPNRELVDNIFNYFPAIATRAYTGVKPDLSKNVFVSTYKTYAKHFKAFDHDLMIVDEGYHLPSPTIKRIMDQSKGLTHCLTATPNRLDGAGLFPQMRDLHLSPQISWFINEGFLSDYQLITSECPLFKSSDGSDDLGSQSKLFGSTPECFKTVQMYHEQCYRERAIIFVSGQEHGQKLVNMFNDSGVYAEFVTSKTDRDHRDLSLAMFRTGHLKVLININLFTEGVNVPECENVFLCRFTYSTALYLQMVGRLLRVAPGVNKKLFDLASNVWYHGTPKSTFEWSIHGQPWREADNRSSVNFKCENCDADLVNKKFVTVSTHVCCTECHHVNWLEPKVTDDAKKRFLNESVFTVADLSLIDIETASQFVKVLKNKRLYNEKKIPKLLSMEVPTIVKKRALMMLDVPKNTIKFYLEDEE
ncbi:putative DNA repair helicase [Nostoc phage YongM]|nr:putative DNA repair helicase [Nostoc phage YongM]